jgi:hypothetical protein
MKVIPDEEMERMAKSHGIDPYTMTELEYKALLLRRRKQGVSV